MRFAASLLLSLALSAVSACGNGVPATPDTGPISMDAGPIDDAFVAPDLGAVDDAGPDAPVDAAFAPDTNADAGPCTAAGACDPFVATSCGTGMACRPGPTGTSCHATSATTVGVGMPCAHAEDCEAGLVCLTFTAGEGPICHRMCHARSVGECDDGYACNGTFGDACVDLCRPIPPACDIYAQDCAAATDTCTLVRNPETSAPYTGCRPAGTQNEGQPCGGASGTCNHDLICVSTNGVASCRRVCDASASPDPCTAPETCTGLATTWSVHYCQGS